MAKITRIHIGKIIRRELDNCGMTKVEFANKVGVTRAVAYNIFERKSMKTDQLLKISKLLKYDFFAEYSKVMRLKK